MNSTTTKKRCLYDIYAPCDKRKCKREHRCTVFTEEQENLRRYIKEQSICVAYMLFGKCGHVWSMSTPKYKNTHLRLRALKKKFSTSRSVKVISEKPHETIESTVNEVIQSVLTIVEKDDEIGKRDKIISIKDQEIARLTKMVTDLQSRIDGLNSTKEQAEKTGHSVTISTQTDEVPATTAGVAQPHGIPSPNLMLTCPQCEIIYEVPATIAGVAHYGIPSRNDSDDDSGPEWGHDDDDDYFSQYIKERLNF